MLPAMTAVGSQPAQNNSEPLIKADKVMKDFPGDLGGHRRILNGISFSVRAGEFIALTGQSGCGKTTLLRILMGLSLPSAGRLTVSGKEVRGCDRKRTMVFQNSELLPWRTALHNVELGLETAAVQAAERHRIARHYLKLVGLEGAENRRPDQLSGGMRQRIGLARAMAVDPDVMLMDEPFGALDAHTREALQSQLLHLHQQMRKTIIFVTHDLDEAVLLADRVFILSPVGTLEEIVNIDIERPREDAARLRSTRRFNDLRYHIWETMKQLETMTRDTSQVNAS